MKPTAAKDIFPPPLPRGCRAVKDAVLHTCAPPVVESDAPRLDELAEDCLLGSLESIEIDASRDAGVKRESAGWFSSLAVHAVILVVLWLLLAPADFGGLDTQNLYMTFVHEDKSAQEDAPIAVALLEDETDMDEPDPPPKEPPPSPSLDGAIAVANDSGADDGQSKSRASSASGAATGGSFFGIEAEGHEFVYVLDMSGSMRGRRFSRATAELVRSVSALRESQNFYVVLFSSSTVQMFDGSSFSPKPIPATAENKEALSQWLSQSFRGGGTDPREALRVAMRMNPSAIFMLSDGEFNGQKKQARASLVGGNPDAFSIVAAASTTTPIHAIAFEDPQSCANMKRLSEMTGGEYRFSGFEAGAAASESLAMARAAIDRGVVSTAEILLRETISSFGSTESGWQARKELAALRFQSAQKAIENDDIEAAKAALLEIVDLDPTAIVSAEFQEALVDALLNYLPRQSGREDEPTAISALAEIVDRFPTSKTTQRIVGPVANGLMDEALELAANGRPAASLLKMERVIETYPLTLAAGECRATRKQLIDDLLAEGRELRRTKDDAAYARYLRALVASFDGTQLETLATQDLENLAFEMLTRARDANYQRDWAAKTETNRQLEEGFGGDRILAKMRREFSRAELKARDLLRRGNQLEKVAGVDAAIRQYNELINHHPGTLAAQKARDRLRDLGLGDEDGTHGMLEMMLESGESATLLLETMQ